ncbi:helix-turn-helix domain-containing protein [Nocardiopsis alba]|uniref:helix-turn-helix domain-containing protein n=1 Tax=Nocardiopsis alba TaxID=53437 RepID=UPI0035D7E39B
MGPEQSEYFTNDDRPVSAESKEAQVDQDADSLCVDSKKALGEHLKRLRKVAGLSGYRLSGVDQSTVSRIETGRIRPSHELLTRLLDAYEADQEGREQAYLLWDQAQLPLQTRRRQVEGTRPAWDQAARPACGPTLLAGASAAEDAARYLTRAQWAGNSPARRNALLDDAEERLVQALAALHVARTRTPAR